MNLPNFLTLSRIFLVPFLIVVLLYWQKNITAALIFSVAGITDWLDGMIARRRNQVTDFGRLLDPIADKLLISAALISLVGLNRAPAWIVFILIGRELAVTVFRGILVKEGFVLSAERLGKLKLIFQVTAIILLIVNISVLNLMLIGLIALYIATILSLVSGVRYFINNWHRLSPGM